MSKNIYDELFDFYHINRARPNIRNIRSTIRERLKKQYPGKTWDELDDYQRYEFKVHTMRDYLLKHTGYAKKVEKQLEEAQKGELEAFRIVNEHNEQFRTQFIEYYKESDTEEEQKKAYKEFCNNVRQLFPKETIPSFEAWKNHPITLYSIQQSSLDEALKEYQSKNYSKPLRTIPIKQSEIDHIIIECILKFLEEKYKVTVDVSAIEDCLKAQKYKENSLDLPIGLLSEQRNVNLESANIIKSLERLKNLDFISPIKEQRQ